MKHIKIKPKQNNPVVVCSGCDKELRHATSGECVNPTVYQPEYCDECLEKIVDEYKHWT